MKYILAFFFLAVCCSSINLAQRTQDVRDEKTRKLLDDAKKSPGAKELSSKLTVNGNVHVQAVLIPREAARRIFGSEIANNYAVIEINVGNKSPDAALIIHGIFIDYSAWPLSGASRSAVNAARSGDAFQESNFPDQVASEEYRVVRGEMLDAQTDTLRNRLMRWLTLAGNLAGAYSFSIGEQGILRGIAAATGVGIPGVATAYPDKSVDQLNRISDLGFRSNKVIPKDAADVIVCFFPIDRFLTPGFKRIFLKRPAVFFAPFLLVTDTDRAVRKDLDAALKDLLKDSETGLKAADIRQALPCYRIVLSHPEHPGYNPCLDDFGLEGFHDNKSNEDRLRVKVQRGSQNEEVKDATGRPVPDAAAYTKFKKFMIIDFLGAVSLNRVNITIDGVMAVDVNTIAARVDEVVMDKLADCGDANGECFWTNLTINGGVRTGVIRGAYLKGGEVAVAEQDALHLEALKKVDEGSDDGELHFSFKLTSPVSNQTKLHFTVTKPAPSEGAKPIESNSYEYLVAYAPTAIGIESAKVLAEGKKVEVKVRRKSSAAVKFMLHPDSGSDVAVAAEKVTADPADQNKFVLSIDDPTLAVGCWSVQVESGGLSSNRSNRFAIAREPKIDTAVRHEKIIQITGTDLVDYSHCGGQRITFKLLKEGATAPIAVDVLNWNGGKPVLGIPAELKADEKWKGKVEVYLDGAKKSEVDLTSSF
jgi:hypothetical protein